MTDILSATHSSFDLSSSTHILSVTQRKYCCLLKDVLIFLHFRQKPLLLGIECRWASRVGLWHKFAEVVVFACVFFKVSFDSFDNRRVLDTFCGVDTADQLLLPQHAFIDHHRQENVVLFPPCGIFGNSEVMNFQAIARFHHPASP